MFQNFDFRFFKGASLRVGFALLAFLALAPPAARADDGKMQITLTPPLPRSMTYWFSREKRQTEPLPLAAPASGNKVTLTVPAAFCQPDALLEIQDLDKKRIAHLPVNAGSDGAPPRISEANLLFSSAWGVNAMQDADRALVMQQWRGWLRKKRVAEAQGRKIADGRTSPNQLQNADFADGLPRWNMENSKAPAHADAAPLSNPGLPKGVSGRAMRCSITTAGTESWHLQFVQAGVNCEEGTPYTVSFWGRADHARKIVVSASVDAPDWHLIGMYQTVNLSSVWQRYSLAFLPIHSLPNHTRFAFAIADATGTVDIAGVSIRAGVDFAGLQAMPAPQIALAQNDFQYSPSVQVPITVNGLPVAEGRVTLRNQEVTLGTYELQESDKGAARFLDVPLNSPLKLAVSAGGKSAEFTRIVAEDKSATTEEIALPGAWRGVKTIAATTSPTPDAPQTGNGTLWITLGVVAALTLALGIGLLILRKPKATEVPDMSRALTTQPASLNLSTRNTASLNSQLNPPLNFPERQTVGARKSSRALPEALPEQAGCSAQLVAIAGKYSGSAFPLDGERVVIGRDAACAVPLPLDSSASRRHAAIEQTETGLQITDNQSSNGTFVNGVRLTGEQPHPLRPGDEIEIGASRFRYES